MCGHQCGDGYKLDRRVPAIGIKNPLFPSAGMTPTDNNKWNVLRELARTCFPKYKEVADAMRRAEELAGQQLAGAAAFVEPMEAPAQGEQEMALDAARVTINMRPCTVVGSRKAPGGGGDMGVGDGGPGARGEGGIGGGGGCDTLGCGLPSSRVCRHGRIYDWSLIRLKRIYNF
jgi:hypothetical protein